MRPFAGRRVTTPVGPLSLKLRRERLNRTASFDSCMSELAGWAVRFGKMTQEV